MRRPKIRFGKRHFHLPQSRAVRIGVGVLFVAFGLVGFLPVVGFWMIPVGLLILSVDIPILRRWRRQLVVWWHRRRGDPVEEDGATVAKPGKNGR